MIRFTRTAVVAGGHLAEAMAFAGAVTQFVDERYPDAGLRWGLQVGGTAGVLHWSMDLPDMAALERLFTELSADGEYLSLVDAAGQSLVSGRTHDTIVSLIG